MSLNKLYFNRVDFKKNPDGSVSFRPNLICPVCRKYVDGKLDEGVSPTYLTTAKLPRNPVSKIVDINAKTVFVMPCCGAKIELYVAVHGEALCISVEQINVDWWKQFD